MATATLHSMRTVCSVEMITVVAYRACHEVPSARSFANLGRILAEGLRLQWGPLSATVAAGWG